MDIYTIKENNLIFKYYSKLFDKKYLILKFISIISFTIILGLVLFEKSTLNEVVFYGDIDTFLQTVLYKGNITFDMIIPLCAALTLIFSLYKDYNNNAYEIMMFLDASKYINNLVKRFIFYTSLWCIISILFTFIAYINFSKIISIQLLLLKYIPPILLFSALTFTLLVYSKNVTFSSSIVFTLFAYELFSGGRFSRKFAVYFDVFYINTLELIYINRISMIILSSIILAIGISKTKKL